MFFRGSFRKNGYYIPSRTLSDLKLRIIYQLIINFKYDVPIKRNYISLIDNIFNFPANNIRFGGSGIGKTENLNIKYINNLNFLEIFPSNIFNFPVNNIRFGGSGIGKTENLNIKYNNIESDQILILVNYSP